MITSKDNEKLKLIRKLADRKHRERERLFVTEGEDLLAAGLGAGHEPKFVLRDPDSDVEGEPVERELLDAVSTLGSGTRVVAVWSAPAPGRPTLHPIGDTAGRSPRCVYLHGVGDPGNVGAIVRTAGALTDATVALGPGCADPYGPKALRGTMGAIFTVPVIQATIEDTPEPRVALVAHGGEADPPTNVATICLGAERDGLPAKVVDACEHQWTIPVRDDVVESLGVAASAAVALSRIGSPLAGD